MWNDPTHVTLASLLLTLAAGCREASTPVGAGAIPRPDASASASSKGVPNDPSHVAIFDAAKSLGTHWRAINHKTFTPTAGEVAEVEGGLADMLRANAPKPRNAATPLADRALTFYRQYGGYIDDVGNRVVWANFFCQTHGTDWRTDLEMVKDGGDCYFQFEYVLEKKQYRSLSINGDG